VKPKAVLAYCREKGIKAVDLRFVDVDGQWRHVTFPLSALMESSFEEGFGHEVLLDPQSDHPPSHAILLPHSEANYLDPFTSQPTLALLTTVQDALMRDENVLDARCVARRAMQYLSSTSVGDGVLVRSSCPFRLSPLRKPVEEIVPDRSTYLACGPSDRDFIFRCQIADLASDSGLQVNRHLNGFGNSSEIHLKPAGLVESSDDVMMLRYLVGQHAWRTDQNVSAENLWLNTQWSILRAGEPIFAGAVHRGLSEVGVHAMAGILRHADAIAAIATAHRQTQPEYSWLRICSSTSVESVVRAAVASHNPRFRTVEFRGAPADCNPYLVGSAVLMAMLDGIQNKVSPGNALSITIEGAADSIPWRIGQTNNNEFSPKALQSQLDSDREFLTRGEVFGDELIDVLCSRFD
jgi:glutamine synthetase